MFDKKSGDRINGGTLRARFAALASAHTERVFTELAFENLHDVYMEYITVKINGKPCIVCAGETLEQCIVQMGHNPQRCVAEVNGAAYNYNTFKDIKIKEGDVIEIMRVVAGG